MITSDERGEVSPALGGSGLNRGQGGDGTASVTVET